MARLRANPAKRTSLSTAAAPVESYEAYGVPAAPAVSYDYGTPQQYAAQSNDYQQYGEPTGYSDANAVEDASLFDLSSITSYLPFFLSIFAAIIVAQLFAPLLGMLFGAKLDLASGILAPLSSAKIGLVNAVLSPFNLVLGNVGTCTPATGRSLGAGWNMSPDNVLNMIFKANEIYSGKFLTKLQSIWTHSCHS